MAEGQLSASRTKFGGSRLKGLAALSASIFVSSPALAQGFNMTQLLGYGFEVKAAVAGARPGAEVLILQGRLPQDSQESVMRCVVRAEAAGGASNCVRVY